MKILILLIKQNYYKSLNNILPNCKDINFRIFGLSLATINFILSIALTIITIRYHYNEKKTDKKKLEEFIRVDHAGERGAIKIYEGQLLALNTLNKDEKLKKLIEDMKLHEEEHSEYFEKEINKRNIKPTRFLKVWDLLGLGLGFGSTILGKKAAMLCTASVEEVIDKHYQNQIDQLGDDEIELKKKIIKFREDELHHKDIAFEEGASKDGLYKVLDGIIKTGSKIAIKISEKY